MNSVLIIDDEEVDFLIHSKIIKKGNFAENVIYQNSGYRALSYFKELLNNPTEWPTHIFVDINMPDMNGFQFIDAYNELPGVDNFKTKIYILSSSESPQDKAKAKQVSVISDYIVKPLSIDKAKSIFTQDQQ